jgi:hypothetical protein
VAQVLDVARRLAPRDREVIGDLARVRRTPLAQLGVDPDQSVQLAPCALRR